MMHGNCIQNTIKCQGVPVKPVFGGFLLVCIPLMLTGTSINVNHINCIYYCCYGKQVSVPECFIGWWRGSCWPRNNALLKKQVFIFIMAYTVYFYSILCMCFQKTLFLQCKPLYCSPMLNRSGLGTFVCGIGECKWKVQLTFWRSLYTYNDIHIILIPIIVQARGHLFDHLLNFIMFENVN